MQIIDGKVIAEDIRKQLVIEVETFKKSNIYPKLDIVLIGNDPASHLYVNKKITLCNQVGIGYQLHHFDSISKNELEEKIKLLNGHGLLIQLPLPNHIDRQKVINLINPKNDIDCFHPENIGLLFHGCPRFLPCTPYAIIKMLEYNNIPIVGKHFVIINDSIIIGKPLALLLINKGATVTVCNKFTKNLQEISLLADILIVAVGKRPEFVLDGRFCKEGVIILDVGMNKIDGRVCGDVDLDSVKGKAKLVSKTPGGIGLITVHVLLQNILQAVKISLDNNNVVC